MKVIKIFLVAILGLKMATAMANDFTTRGILGDGDPLFRIQAVEDNRYRVFFQGEQLQRVGLRIYDQNREKVYAEYLGKTQEFAKLYDLGQLPQGTYFVELVGKGWKKSQQLTILKVDGKKKFEAKFTVLEEGERVLMQIDNPEIKEVGVYIEDRIGTVMFSDKVELNADGSRSFRFKGYIKGNYTFRVFAGTSAQTEVLNLRK